MSTLKNTSEKEIAQNKVNAIEKSKEAIKNVSSKKMSNKNLLEIDLETLDLNNLKGLIKDNVKTKNISERLQMYKFERTDLESKEVKKLRTKIRNQRNKICDNILHSFSTDNATELKKHITLFNSFYKETYLLNDFSLISICQSNADDDTKVKLSFMLKIIKETKAK